MRVLHDGSSGKRRARQPPSGVVFAKSSGSISGAGGNSVLTERLAKRSRKVYGSSKGNEVKKRGLGSANVGVHKSKRARCGAKHRAQSDSGATKKKTSAKRLQSLNEGRTLKQTFLDLGQSDFDNRTCHICRMTYAPGVPQDGAAIASFVPRSKARQMASICLPKRAVRVCFSAHPQMKIWIYICFALMRKGRRLWRASKLS